MTTEYRFTVDARPVGKNDLYQIGRDWNDKRAGAPRIVRTAKAKSFIGSVMACAVAAKLPAILDGEWSIEITAHWPTKLGTSRKKRGKALCGGGPLRGGPFPGGDSDAVPVLVRDALEEGLFVDDDARITTTIGHSKHDKENPRVEVTLRRIG